MKNNHFSFVALIFMAISSSCSSQDIELFHAISVQIPSSMQVLDQNEHIFSNPEKDVTLAFRITENLQLDETLPKLNFDYQVPDHLHVLRDEKMTVSGLEARIVTVEGNENVVVTLLVKIKDELLWGYMQGLSEHVDYMNVICDRLLESMKEI